jgi:hypothetical protein
LQNLIKARKFLGFEESTKRERSKEASYVTEDKREPPEPVHGGGRCGRGLSKMRETITTTISVFGDEIWRQNIFLSPNINLRRPNILFITK